MDLYQKELRDDGWQVSVPTEEEMARFVTPGIALVKANRVAEAHTPLAEAARLLTGRGSRAVVLGCTEIPLGIAAGPALPFPMIDTIKTLALASIRWAKAEEAHLIA